MELARVEIITNVKKVEELKSALGRFGISGMTVYHALGCGVQLGTREFEAEQAEEPVLLPKEVVMLIMPISQLDGFLKFVEEELYTGHIGDGKIIVSDICNVIRVRTGEEGYEALMPAKD